MIVPGASAGIDDGVSYNEALNAFDDFVAQETRTSIVRATAEISANLERMVNLTVKVMRG
jgi:dihydroneopterin aldolase